MCVCVYAKKCPEAVVSEFILKFIPPLMSSILIGCHMRVTCDKAIKERVYTKECDNCQLLLVIDNSMVLWILQVRTESIQSQ